MTDYVRKLAICNSVTVLFTIIEWKLQYTVYWPLGLFSVSLKRHNENIVQHLPEHMLFLCFHAQNVMKCAVTCRCWLKMLTKPTDVSILLLWLKYQHMQQSPNVFCSNRQTNKHIFIAAQFLTKSSAVHSYPRESLMQTMAGNRHIQLNPTGKEEGNFSTDCKSKVLHH